MGRRVLVLSTEVRAHLALRAAVVGFGIAGDGVPVRSGSMFRSFMRETALCRPSRALASSPLLGPWGWMLRARGRCRWMEGVLQRDLGIKRQRL